MLSLSKVIALATLASSRLLKQFPLLNAMPLAMGLASGRVTAHHNPATLEVALNICFATPHDLPLFV